MNRLIPWCTMAIGLLATPALAADLPDPYEPVTPEVYGPTVFSWAGPYLGAQIGYNWGNVSGAYKSGRVGIDTDGVGGGLYGGYNFQVTPNVVLGAEADVTWADLQGDRRIAGFDYKARTDWMGSVRARAGFALDRFLAYGTGGIAFASTKLEKSGVGSSTNGAVGWALGGGVEYAVTDNIVARGEYIYQGFGKQDYGKINVRDVDFNTNTVRAGVGYKF